jgi:hypothetical protein
LSENISLPIVDWRIFRGIPGHPPTDMNPFLDEDAAASLLRGILGSRAESLDPTEHSALVREFAQAGRSAVLARAGTADEAASALDFSRALASTARARLASETAPGSPSGFDGPDWAPVTRAIEEHREMLRALPGITGFGPGFRRREGVRGDERCVVVYVRRKREPNELDPAAAVPPLLRTGDGITVPTDVVEFGTLRRQVNVGERVGRASKSGGGTIGAFAIDIISKDPLAITAMHVAGSVSKGARFVCPPDGQAGSATLGGFVRGTLRPVDAAAITVKPPRTGTNKHPQVGRLRGWRPVTLDGDKDIPVRMLAGKQGKVVNGHIVEPRASELDGLEDVILADIRSVDGDSGSALIDEDGFLLGFLVGRAKPPANVKKKHPGLQTVRVFTPVSLVLDQLGCDIISDEDHT